MRKLHPSLEQVLNSAAESGYINGDWRNALEANSQLSKSSSPWHSRVLIGFGAWLGSLLFIGFFTAIGMAIGGFWLYGIGLLAGGIALSRTLKGDFWEQVALAFSLSGQAFILVAVSKEMGRGNVVEVCSTAAIILNSILLFLFRSNVHRFISIQFITISVLALIFALKIRFLVPFVSPLLFVSAVYLLNNEPKYLRKKYSDIIPTLVFGLLISSLIAVSLSAVYIFPEWSTHKQEPWYPMPWLSTGILTLSVLIFAITSKDSLFSKGFSGVSLYIYSFIMLVGLLTNQAPGIVLSLGTIIFGAIYLDRNIRLLGINFLAIFVGLFFYGTGISLLMKSFLFVAAGVALLVGRKFLLREMEK